MVQWLSLHTPNAGAWGLIRGQGTRSHMLQLSSKATAKRSLMPQEIPTKILGAATKIPHSQINKEIFKKKNRFENFFALLDFIRLFVNTKQTNYIW